MLHLGDDWQFPIDASRTKVWLTPRGEWGIDICCVETKLKTADGLGASFAPELRIKGLHFDGFDWREFVGMEIFQHGAWRGEGEPEANLYVVEEAEIFETKLRITGHEGTQLKVSLEATGDVFFDDKHDTNVPLRLECLIPFEGVRFRFRAEGADSKDPSGRAKELLAQYLDRDAFGPPELTSLSQPGLFQAHFPPIEDGAEEEADDPLAELSAEQRVLVNSALELLSGMIKHGWLELEGELSPKLAAGFVEQLEERSDRGTRRASRIVDWLLDAEGVEEVHCADEELAPILDKWW